MPPVDQPSKPAADRGGGAAAMRGFYVQTLTALLNALIAEPPLISITLEPAGAQDQFDFCWRDAVASHAVQVKSSINAFSLSEVKSWAEELQAASQGEQCCLILVGHCGASLNKVSEHLGVRIEKRPLDVQGLDDAAAQKLAKFLEANQLPAGTAIERDLLVDSLMGALFKQSITRQELSREEFIQLLLRLTMSARTPTAIDISRIIKYAPSQLLGREAETQVLSDAWSAAMQARTGRARIVGFVALGGEGKTSLLADWAARMAAQDWPGCAAVFAWSFYSQGTDQQLAASSELFLNSALSFFGDDQLAASAASGEDKAKRLAALVGAQRSLLLLDGMEPLQYPPTSPLRGELRDRPMALLLKTLATHGQSLCVLTTRYEIGDLRGLQSKGVQQHTLLRLPPEAGIALLRNLEVRGSAQEMAAMVEEVQGHALTLQLLGSYLRDAHGGDIRRRDQITFAEADREEQGGHAFRVMDAYVRWFDNADGDADAKQPSRIALALLKLMGLFDRPASEACLTALWQAPVIVGLTDALENISEAQRNLSLTRLAETKLLTVNRDASGTMQTLDAHPLLRAYFAQRLQAEQHSAWQAAHALLYCHLRDTTQDKPQPQLEDLQPLYQAVAHGCLAGMQQQACDEVYSNRILLGNESYSLKKLGAFGTDLGAVACFFEQPWQRVSANLIESVQAFLLNEAAFCLRALGRLIEAVEPMRTGLEMLVQQKNWEQATKSAGNLAELAQTLGDVAGAVQYAKQAVDYADRSEDAFLRMGMRTILADALHQAGQLPAANALFAEAEHMQTEWQPSYPLLYSVQGFRYVEVLLAIPEAVVWQCNVREAQGNTTLIPLQDAASQALPSTQRPNTIELAAHLSNCDLLLARMTQTLTWMQQANLSLLGIALEHLNLARTKLYAAILANQPLAPSQQLPQAQQHLQQALDGLRRAGTADHLPRALLTQAWLLSHIGQHTGPDSAQSALDEAWEIAERGPMPLFMADIHLHRAAFFWQVQPYPWQSAEFDAKGARHLIEKHGYLRRLAALQLVEQALQMS